MIQWLRLSTAYTAQMGPFLDSANGVTPLAGLTIAQADIRISKNGGAFAQSHNSAGATYSENGYYAVPLDTVDTNTLGTLRVAISKAGALPVWQDYMVMPTNIWEWVPAVTLMTPVLASGDIGIRRGFDYNAADGNSFVWSGVSWPNLAGATVTWHGCGIDQAMTVLQSGVGSQIIQLELTATQTGAIDLRDDPDRFSAEATLSSGRKVVLMNGNVWVKEAAE